MKIALYQTQDSRSAPILGKRGADMVQVLDCTDDEDGTCLAIVRDMEVAKKLVATVWPEAEILD